MTQRGVAYQLWAAVEDERLTRGWTKQRMAEYIGLPRNTINNLQDSPRPPLVRTVHTVADAMGWKRQDAERLAGLRPPEAGEPGAVSARDAILRDPNYTEEQRQAMLQLVDIFARANQAAAGHGEEREAS